MAKTSSKPKFLGQQTKSFESPQKAILDTFPNPSPDRDFVARFVVPEFTSLCPVTGQPDFAHFVIDYMPNKLMVESKSLKLFMHSFRNQGDYHEKCTMYVAERLEDAMRPFWIRVAAFWMPRGGIPIDVFYHSGKPPEHIYVPEIGVPPYRGRG